jgi:hypothetical protein
LYKNLKALGMCKEHAKMIKNTRHLGRGLKTPSAHGKCMKRIESIRCTPRAHNKNQQHLAHIKGAQQGWTTLGTCGECTTRINNTYHT